MTTVRRAVKNVVGNYSDIQVKVREATSNDPWGPSGALMSDIADATYNVIAFDDIISLLWRRLNDSGKNWRHVYKALTVLDYILKTGSERVFDHCKDNIFTIQTLKDFVFIDKEGKDQGTNVREKSKHLVQLLKDEERLKYDRSKAIKAKDRFHAALPVGSTHSKQRRSSLESSSRSGTRVESPATTTSLQTSPNNTGSKSWQTERRANSSSPAAAAGTRAPVQRQGTLSSDMARAKPSSEQEEALRLGLAMALSRQDAEQEVKAKEREEDDLKTVLQATCPADPFFSTPTTTDGATARSAAQATNDPWGGAASTQLAPPGQAAAVASAPASASAWENFDDRKHVVVDADPWGTNTKVSPAAAAAAPPATAMPPNSVTPELFPSSNGFGSPRVTARDPDVPAAPAAPASFDPRPLDIGMNSTRPEEPKSLEKKFLGEHGTLVNLDAIGGQVPVAAAPSAAAANPFSQGLLSPPGTGVRTAQNPFQKDKPQNKSLNEMRTKEFQSGDGGSLLPAPLVPESQSDVRRSSVPYVTPGRTIGPGGSPVMPTNRMMPMAAGVGMQQPVQMVPAMVPMQPAMAGYGAAANPFMATANAGRNPNGFY
eukprot:scpid43270/ scgid25706/ Epsin-2; EPS-15-interacting protein 2; Intersectin-EH-binding protein 2